MAEIEIAESIIAAQRVADQAWNALESYRKQVDDRRRAESPDNPNRLPWQGRTLLPWTEEEQAEFDRLQQAAVAASQARRDAMTEAGQPSTFDVEVAARAGARS